MQLIAIRTPVTSPIRRAILTRPAPMSGNDLADDGANPYTAGVMASVSSSSPSAAAATTAAPADTGPGFWSKVGGGLWDFAQSDAAKNLANAGMNFYTAKQGAKTAQAGADAAAKSASAQAKLTAVQAQLLASQQKPKTPSWVIPAVIGGVAVVGLIAFLALRKKA